LQRSVTNQVTVREGDKLTVTEDTSDSPTVELKTDIKSPIDVADRQKQVKDLELKTALQK
jgi:hypothetical protein